jgi:hypothetical protein
MTRFNELNNYIKNKFTLNGKIPVTNNFFNPEQYRSLIIPNWDTIINDYITRFTKENISSENHGKENYPKGDLQYKEGGASYYLCKVLDTLDVKDKTVAVIGSENPWIEAILYNYGCRDIVTIEYNKPTINNTNFRILNYEEFTTTDIKFDYILSYSSIEHSGLGRYGDVINPDGDIETMDVIKNKLKSNGKLVIGIPIGLDTLVWNANRIYGNIRLPILLNNFKIIEWYGGDKSCLDFKPIYNGVFAPQPILLCSLL